MVRKKKSAFTEDDDALLSELGVDTKVAKPKKFTAKEERIIAGFEEIQRFVAEHGRPPAHGEQNDIFERLYAVRLDQIRKSDDCVALLKDMDPDELLTRTDIVKEDDAEYEINTDDELLKALGVDAVDGDNDLTNLKHVRSRAEIKAAEEIARRQPCEDFDEFRPVFDSVQSELDAGLRITERYQAEGSIGLGDLFIVEGNKVIVAELGEEFIDAHNNRDRRTRVIYDNGTESNLLLRSLQKALWRDPAGRRIMDLGHDPHPLFTAAELEDEPIFVDTPEYDDELSGYLYILRSKSEHPFVAEHRELLHKIGFTRGELEDRFINASSERTFLLAEVELVASYRIANASAGKLENVLHRFFASARIDVKLREEVGGFVEPREWFLLPLQVIQEAIKLIRTGGIAQARYDLGLAKISPNEK
jgi:hypothetical protein